MNHPKPYITNGDSLLLTRLESVPVAPLQNVRQKYLTIIADQREHLERVQHDAIIDKLRPILGIARREGRADIAAALLAIIKGDNRLSQPANDKG